MNIGTGEGDRLRRPGKGPVLASVAIHVLALVGVWWSEQTDRDSVVYLAYEIEIVSLGEDTPEAAPVVEEAPVVVSRVEAPPAPEPEPEPPAPEPEPVADPEPEPERQPEPDREPTPDPAPPAPDATPTPDTRVAETPSVAAMAVRMEGLRRDFPAYYQGILEEVERCFRWNGADGLFAVVRFEIQRAGAIPGPSIRLFTRSGNTLFDIQTVSAVECAGGGIGPLPEDMPMDVLPVQFTFGEQRRPGE